MKTYCIEFQVHESRNIGEAASWSEIYSAKIRAKDEKSAKAAFFNKYAGRGHQPMGYSGSTKINDLVAEMTGSFIRCNGPAAWMIVDVS